jgi:hypothetical protein
MQLRPRHFILFAVIIALFAYNVVRYHHQHQATTPQTTATAAPAWSVFDKAAALRDAPDADFQPAFTTLRTATEAPDASPNDGLTDVRACKTWLVFYRNPQWRPNATKHINGCLKYHRDTIE